MSVGNIIQSILEPVVNNFEIMAMALEHNPYILFAILIAVSFFLIAAILALKKANNGASSILKFAPSVLTSLGLLGTFLALTASLGGLQTNELGSISNESLSTFIKSLKPVFSFSILGIGFAILFMIVNFFILAYRNKYIITQKNNHQLDAQSRQAKSQELNQSTLQELKNQSYYLNNLANISSKTNTQNDYLQEISGLAKQQGDVQKTQAEAQQQLFMTLSNALTRMSSAITNIETGYDMDKLGDVISEKIGEVLTEPLAQMTQALEKNNSDVIHTLLADLKEDILIPIKNEIVATNETTNKVIIAVDKSQATNIKLISKLEDVTYQMDSFVKNTETLVETMASTVVQMNDLQKNQDRTLKEFNTDLQDNLAGIQPAIEEGMKTAKDGMISSITSATAAMSGAMQSGVKEISNTVDQMGELQKNQDKTLKEFNSGLKDTLSVIEPAIEKGMKTAEEGMVSSITLATAAMNDAMTNVITQISEDVIETLGAVLVKFDNNMDNHLTRMNNELALTGKRASTLIDDSAKNLKDTLGDIDKTLDDSSKKLKEELEAFRTEYQFSLNTFFTQQNEALEQTLGVQNKRLQETADQLGKQFESMDKAQQQLNQESLQTIDRSREVYEPLLDQMATIASTLNKGQNTLVKDLRAMQDHTSEINRALNELGENMPKEFTEAFKILNDAYINKFNSSNEVLEKMMKEMITASAVLLTASNSQHQDSK